MIEDHPDILAGQVSLIDFTTRREKHPCLIASQTPTVATRQKRVVTGALACVRVDSVYTGLVALIPHFALVYVHTGAVVGGAEHLTGWTRAHTTCWRLMT